MNQLRRSRLLHKSLLLFLTKALLRATRAVRIGFTGYGYRLRQGAMTTRRYTLRELADRLDAAVAVVETSHAFEDGRVPGVITISRPDTATNNDLVVSLGYGGTAEAATSAPDAATIASFTVTWPDPFSTS